MATHSSILAWKNPMNRGGWWVTKGHKELDTAEQLSVAWLSPKFPLEVATQLESESPVCLAVRYMWP